MAQITTNPQNRDGNQTDEEPTSLTAIFRPDDAGAWREKLRQSHEESMRQGNGGASNEGGYMSRMSQLGMPRMGASGWDIQSGGDDTSGILGSHAEEDEDEEGSSLMGDDGGKKWKVRKTLRK
jgi:striatin 1/3/4